MAPGVKMRATALLLLSQATALWHCPCGERAAAAAKAALTDRRTSFEMVTLAGLEPATSPRPQH